MPQFHTTENDICFGRCEQHIQEPFVPVSWETCDKNPLILVAYPLPWRIFNNKN